MNRPVMEERPKRREMSSPIEGSAMMKRRLREGVRAEMSSIIEGTAGRYMPSEAEIDRYKQHGMARLHFSNMRPTPYGSGFINVGPLIDVLRSEDANKKVGMPAFAWVKRGPVPAIIVSSGLQKSDAKKSMVAIDAGRTIDGIRFNIKFSYCRGNEVQLEPIYKETGVKVREPAVATV